MAALRRLRRIRLHLPMAVAALALAHPNVKTAPWAVALVLIGMALRGWAAGVLVKGGGLCVWGPYQYVRHPLYLGTTLGALGLSLLANSIWAYVVVLPVFLLIYAWQVGYEERALAVQYGEAHAAWSQRVPMFLPRLLPVRPEALRPWTLHQACQNREQFHALVTALLVFLFFLKPLLLGGR